MTRYNYNVSLSDRIHTPIITNIGVELHVRIPLNTRLIVDNRVETTVDKVVGLLNNVQCRDWLEGHWDDPHTERR